MGFFGPLSDGFGKQGEGDSLRPIVHLPLMADLIDVYGRLTNPTFARTSGAYFHNADGYLEYAAANTPRYTADGLLMEPAATNLFSYSNDFSEWVNTRVTLEQSVEGPDGTGSATHIKPSVDDDTHFVSMSLSAGDITDATDYCVSFYVKPVQTNWIRLQVKDKANAFTALYLNVTTGAQGTGGLDSGWEELANGWYRVWFIFNSDTGVTDPVIYIQLATADGTNSFIGDTSAYTTLAHAQLEIGTFPTSPILCEGAATARTSDLGSGTTGVSWDVPSAMDYIFEGPNAIGSYTVKVITAGVTPPANQGLLGVRSTTGAGLLYLTSTHVPKILDGTTAPFIPALPEMGYGEEFAFGGRWDKTADGGTGYLELMAKPPSTNVWEYSGPSPFDGAFQYNNVFRLGVELTQPLWVKDVRIYNVYLSDSQLETLVA